MPGLPAVKPRVLRPFKSAQFAIVANREAWLQSATTAYHVATDLYILIRDHHPYLWEGKNPPKFDGPRADVFEAVLKLSQLFRRVYPKDELKIGVLQEPMKTRKPDQRPRYTMTCRYVYPMEQKLQIGTLDWWAHWRMVRRGKDQRVRQRLALHCIIMLNLYNTGEFMADDQWVNDPNWISEELWNAANAHINQEKATGDILQSDTPIAHSAKVRRLLMSLINRSEAGPMFHMQQLCKRYFQLIKRRRRAHMNRIHSELTDVQNASDTLPGLAVMQDMLEDELQEYGQGLYGLLPQDEECKRATIGDDALCRLCWAVNMLSRHHHDGRLDSIAKYTNPEGLESEYCQSELFPLWWTNGDYIGRTELWQIREQIGSNGISPLMWVRPLEPGASRKEAKLNTQLKRPNWPEYFQEAMSALISLSDSYRYQYGNRVGFDAVKKSSARAFLYELEFQRFYKGDVQGWDTYKKTLRKLLERSEYEHPHLVHHCQKWFKQYKRYVPSLLDTLLEHEATLFNHVRL